MVFLDCSWLYRTLEDSLDDVIKAKDQEMIKQLVVRLLEYYAKQTDNTIDDQVVELVRSKLTNTPLPKDNVFMILKDLATLLPSNEYRSDLIAGLAYIEEHFDEPHEQPSIAE